MIKAVIFDIGGVIQGVDWSFVVNSLLDLKKDLSIDTYRSAFYNEREKYLDLYETSKISREDFWGMVGSKIGIKNVDRLSESFEFLYSFVNNDILELIKKLRHNYKVYALSNACPEIEKKAIKDDNYMYLFDKVYFSHNIGARKPDKEAYLRILEENDLKPEECIFIDNNIKNVAGAERLGIHAMLISNTDSLKKDLFAFLEKTGKKNKKIVGYTTGVFDLFHEGHLNLLRNAKENCDILIVGITTDELSLSFKGKRPVIPLNERMRIVKAMKYVDRIVPQENMDKFEAWKKYRFDVMFASDTPTDEWPKVEAEFLSKFANEGFISPKIVRLPYTPGVSSTLRRNILKG